LTVFDRQKEYLSTATTCAAVIGEICETLRPQNVEFGNGILNLKSCEVTIATTNEDYPSSSSSSCMAKSETILQDDLLEATNSKNSEVNDRRPPSSISVAATSKSICDIPKLMQRLKSVMEAIPKQVPVVVYVDPLVPRAIIADELPIFRAALNLLSSSCDRASTGNVRFSISVTSEIDSEFLGNSEELLFTCVDAGPPFSQLDSLDDSDCGSENSTDDSKTEQKTSRTVLLESFGKSTLSSVSALVRSVGGDFGIDSLENDEDLHWRAMNVTFENGSKPISRKFTVAPTTKFWFKIPLFVPEAGCEGENIHDKSTILLGPDSSVKFLPEITSFHQNTETIPNRNDSKKKRALVIDDSIVIRKTLARALVALGYETVQAEDGLAGLKILQSDVFDIVLCDFLMPVMDGMDCVREYRCWEESYRTGAQQFIVGMSAHASRKDAERAIKVGMDLYVSKPIFLQQLKELIEFAERRTLSLGESVLRSSNPNELSSTEFRMDVSVGKLSCLIGADKDIGRRLDGISRDNQFVPFLAESCEEFTRMIKARNWMVVLIDESFLANDDGPNCIQVFRDWEKQYRVHRQKNVYLMSKGYQSPSGACNNPMSELSHLQPGIDGVLENPVHSETLSKIFETSKSFMTFAADDIVTSS
jgi:CheY-like chemotaxis protein